MTLSKASTGNVKPPLARDWPLISIVTPSFNQADTLEATLLSVLDQGYPALEYIVVDGGSTDGSVEILERFADRLAWWVSEPDGGHGDAINKGFARSNGEVMGWINSDDVLLPGSLRLIGRLFARFSEMLWLTSPGAALDEQGCLVIAFEPFRWTRETFLMREERFLQQESTYWRRELWQRAGSRIDEALISCDHELWARFFRHARLFQTSGLIGAFRYRSQQRSVALRDRYLSEVRATLAREREFDAASDLSQRDCDVVSRLIFDPRTLEFERHDSRSVLRDSEATFLQIDPRLARRIAITSLALPSWGLESTAEIRNVLPALAAMQPLNFVLLWLGSGNAEGLRLVLRSDQREEIEIQLSAAPGPARLDRIRTLRMRALAASGQHQVETRQFECEERLSWRLTLEPGTNRIAFSIDEEPTVAPSQGGEKRALLAVISAVALAPVGRS